MNILKQQQTNKKLNKTTKTKLFIPNLQTIPFLDKPLKLVKACKRKKKKNPCLM